MVPFLWRRGGVVRSTSDDRWLEPSTPSAPAREASRHFLNGRSHPSLSKIVQGGDFASKPSTSAYARAGRYGIYRYSPLVCTGTSYWSTFATVLSSLAGEAYAYSVHARLYGSDLVCPIHSRSSHSRYPCTADPPALSLGIRRQARMRLLPSQYSSHLDVASRTEPRIHH